MYVSYEKQMVNRTSAKIFFT